MPKAVENLILFLFGGVVYSMIEVLSRGYTHWSMTVTGGICLVILYHHYTAHPHEPLFTKCLFGAIVITLMEFIAGCIVNLWLGWNVWDYSGHIFNLFGQICLPFSVIWFFISIPAVVLSGFFNRRFSEIQGRRRLPLDGIPIQITVDS